MKSFSLHSDLSEPRRDQEEGGELDSHEVGRHFCGSRRDQEVVLDPQVSLEEIMSREVELGCESWTSYIDINELPRSYYTLCKSADGLKKKNAL